MTFKDSGRSNYGAKRKMVEMDIFKARSQRSHGIRWRDVDYTKLAAAIGIATAARATLSFSPASGGVGVMVKLYQGDTSASEFAGSAAELEELLTLIIDRWESDEHGLVADFKKVREISQEAAD